VSLAHAEKVVIVPQRKAKREQQKTEIEADGSSRHQRGGGAGLEPSPTPAELRRPPDMQPLHSE